MCACNLRAFGVSCGCKATISLAGTSVANPHVQLVWSSVLGKGGGGLQAPCGLALQLPGIAPPQTLATTFPFPFAITHQCADKVSPVK